MYHNETMGARLDEYITGHYGEDFFDEPEPRYNVRFSAYCGMMIPVEENVDYDDARDACARYLKYLHRKGHETVTLVKGASWESLEPEGCFMVPDTAGILSLIAKGLNDVPPHEHPNR